jgi:serine/threonine-protein kinase
MVAERRRVVGRYTLGAPIGQGGFGVVYAGSDPVLQRPVAIKLLRARPGHPGVDALAREARMAAQLHHPNVVRIFDVGTIDAPRMGGNVFVVMELLEGKTLTRWREESNRSSAHIVSVLLQVARGLLAVHDRGIVHCDIKPTNVIITKVGAKLLDFGLSLHRDPASDWGENGGDRVFAGTPRYMAPEAHEGEAPDEASDQFSFAVMAIEALAGGAYPYAGSSASELYESKLAAIPRAWLEAHIPSRLVLPLQKATARDPRDRHASLGALVDGLRPESSPKLTWALGGASVLTLAIAATREVPPDPSCVRMTEQAAEHWRSHRAGVQQRWRTVEAPEVAAAGLRFDDRVDRYVETWTDASRGVCQANANPDNPQLRCLRGQLRRFAATLDTVEHGTVGVLSHAQGLLGELPSPQACLDPAWAWQQRPLPKDPALLREVEDARSQLSRAEVLRSAGDFGGGIELARRVLADAPSVGFPPLHGEAMRTMGSMLAAVGDHEASVELVEQAYFHAASIGDDALAAQAAVDLVEGYGSGLRIAEKGRAWAKRASAALEQVPGEHVLHADLTLHRANMERVDGNMALARSLATEALNSYAASGDAVAAALAHFVLGAVAGQSGEHPRALEHMTLALETRRRVLGEAHPLTAAALGAVALSEASLGHLTRARALHLQGLEGLELSLGPEHPELALALGNACTTELMLGETEAAVEHGERALRIFEKTSPQGHPLSLFALQNLGYAYDSDEQYARAYDAFSRVLAARKLSYPADHFLVIASQTDVGMSLAKLGRDQEAAALLDDTRLKLERSPPADASRAWLEYWVARAELGERPIEPLESLLEELRPNERAMALQTLSALFERDDPVRARLLGEAAVAQMIEVGAVAHADTLQRRLDALD